MEVAKEVISIDYIPKSYITDEIYREITNCDENIWINLGKETCNLDRWSWYCFFIIQNSFGKTKAKSMFYNISKSFESLQSNLDDLVCVHYPLSISTINNIPITHIFYRIENIIQYPILLEYRRKKYINIDQKVYIITFIERMNEFLKIINDNIDKLVEKFDKKYINIKKNNILKLIEKIKENCDRLAIIINDIQIID